MSPPKKSTEKEKIKKKNVHQGKWRKNGAGWKKDIHRSLGKILKQKKMLGGEILWSIRLAELEEAACDRFVHNILVMFKRKCELG